jgi:LmbE family N-acetylglucosaminyl deacetylase
MGMTNQQGPYNLVCVAHPDDETIFFGGLLLSRVNHLSRVSRLSGVDRQLPWVVICVTSDGNDDRRRQFTTACRELGVNETHWWGFADDYDTRLPINELVTRLTKLATPREIFTHGIVGEYGHPHHQDVSYAVHKAFTGHLNLFSVAYNTFPELEVRLSKEDFALKAHILTEIYGSETNRFLNVLPSTFVEGFLRLDLLEIEAVYDFLARNQPLRQEALRANLWLKDYLPHLRGMQRPF